MKKIPYTKILRMALSLCLVISTIWVFSIGDTAWTAFKLANQQWWQTFTGQLANTNLIDFPDAKAIDWTNAPKSRKHKGFTGGWIIPFEIFEQKYTRPQKMSYYQNEDEVIFNYYSDTPYPIDLNGDGLTDYIYSKATANYTSRPQVGVNVSDYENLYWDNMEQYIALKRTNGYEVVYKCRQYLENQYYYVNNQGYTTPTYWYEGDCADTSSTGTSSINEGAWTPARIWIQEAANWTKTSDSELTSQLTYGQNLDLVYMDQRFYPTPFTTVPTVYRIDRTIPKFRDVNSDGLVDVVFNGQVRSAQDENVNGRAFRGYEWYQTSYILLNNGNGFELKNACALKRTTGTPAWQPACY